VHPAFQLPEELLAVAPANLDELNVVPRLDLGDQARTMQGHRGAAGPLRLTATGWGAGAPGDLAGRRSRTSLLVMPKTWSAVNSGRPRATIRAV
jgi:hypothetical protein